MRTFSMSETDLPDLSQAVKKGAGWFTILGILTLLLGLFAVNAPLFIGITLLYFIGASMIVAGILQITHAIQGGNTRVLPILSGLLSILCGGLLFSKPLFGLGVITLFLIAYFVADGIVKIIHAIKLRPHSGWGWQLFSGVITLILGIAIWRQWPVSGTWAIGVLFGINLIFQGWAMIFTGSAVRNAIKSQ